MERNRETRRASIVGSNGFNRRRHRTNSLRGSPDDDGGVELQESVRLRDRVKKDRDRERERDFRERTGRSKRRRGERDETSEESINDDEYDENEENGGGVRLLTAAVGSISSNNNHHHGHLSNHHTSHGSNLSQQHTSNSNNNITGSNHHLQYRKSFPLGSSSSSSKVFRAAPVWKPDEIISVSVPRKARSASTKRSHDRMSSSSNNNGGGVAAGAAGGEQNLRQASSSPARQGLASTSTPSSAPPAPMSPSSSNPLFRKKLKPTGNNGGPKLKPPKASSKQSSSNPEELEMEIAEVLYGLMTQTQGPSSKKEDSKEVDRSNSDAKSSPISNSASINNQISGSNSNTLQAIAPKRKRPRQAVENSSHVGPMSAKQEMDQMEGNSDISQGVPVKPPEPELKPVAEEELRDSKDLVAKEEERESSTVRNEDSICKDSTLIETATTIIKANSMVSEMEAEKKIEIDLMASPPRARSSPERAAAAMDQKPIQSIIDAESKDKKDSMNVTAEEGKIKSKGDEECESNKEIKSKGRNITLQLDLQKAERNGNVAGVNAGNRLHGQQEMALKATKEEPLITDKSGQSKSSSTPMGFMAAAPLQGVVSMNGTTVTPAPVQPLFTQPRPKRCATHCYIARNIHCLQQLMKMNPFLQAAAAAGSASLFASRPCNNLNIMPTEMHTNKGPNNAQDTKNQSHKSSPSNSVKDKSSQTAATTSDSSQRKQQVLIQQTMPPSNLLGPAFIFPLNQQQAQAATAASARPTSGTPNSAQETARPTSSNLPGSAAMTFNYTNMAAAAANEAQYLAILQNNGYPFPITAPPNYRVPAPALFNNGSFYSSQMIHPSQIQHQQQQMRPQSSGSTNANVQNFQNSEKKPQQSPSHSFAMSFSPINGANGGLDITSMAQNHAIFQSFPEASRQMTAAAHKKNFKMSEDDKSGRGGGGDSSSAATDDERKSCIAFSNNQAQFQQQMAAKFPNGFPQNLVQSPPQSSHWKNSTRAQPVSQAPSTKTLPQPNFRPGTKLQNQISFGGNQKSSTASQDHMTTFTNSKTGQNPSFSTQQSKNQSILGNPNTGAKPQMQQAKNMQQPQLFFSNQYSQAQQSPHSNTNSPNSGPTGFYMQRRPTQQAQASTMTSDPAKAIAAAQFAAAAAAQSAGGALLPAGFSYVQVKPAEQKQPAS